MEQPQSERLFVIHAGTHKTATSYIQSRMLANRELLATAGVHLFYPASPSRKHKPLAEDLDSQEWLIWERYLAAIPQGVTQVLISAEQFTQPLAKAHIHQRLRRLLSQHGFRLRIVVFLRDQPDYINARFVHSTRRFYHHLNFEDYVEKQLRERSLVYDYSTLFASLLSQASIETCFLPFRSGLGDPFERLMQSQGWIAAQPWRPADPSKSNIQPGCRGVWLAQEVARQQQASNRLDASRMVNASAVIRRIAEREGWTTDRYYGFDADLLERVAAHYADSNQRFAQRVWQQSWREVFPNQPLKTCTYQLPAAGAERVRMLNFVPEVMRELRNNRFRRNCLLAWRSCSLSWRRLLAIANPSQPDP